MFTIGHLEPPPETAVGAHPCPLINRRGDSCNTLSINGKVSPQLLCILTGGLSNGVNLATGPMG